MITRVFSLPLTFPFSFSKKKIYLCTYLNWNYTCSFFFQNMWNIPQFPSFLPWIAWKDNLLKINWCFVFTSKKDLVRMWSVLILIPCFSLPYFKSVARPLCSPALRIFKVRSRGYLKITLWKPCLLSKLLTLGAPKEEEKEVFCREERVETQLAGRIQNQELGGVLCDPR